MSIFWFWILCCADPFESDIVPVGLVIIIRSRTQQLPPKPPLGKTNKFWVKPPPMKSILVVVVREKKTLHQCSNAGCSNDAAGNCLLNEEEGEGQKEEEDKEVEYRQEEEEYMVKMRGIKRRRRRRRPVQSKSFTLDFLQRRPSVTACLPPPFVLFWLAFRLVCSQIGQLSDQLSLALILSSKLSVTPSLISEAPCPLVSFHIKAIVRQKKSGRCLVFYFKCQVDLQLSNQG